MRDRNRSSAFFGLMAALAVGLVAGCSGADSTESDSSTLESAADACVKKPWLPKCSAAHSVTLSWNASPTAGVTYSVYRSITSGGGYTQQATGVSALSWVDAAVTSGATYYYVVRAHDANGDSSDSNEIPAVIP